MGNIQDGDINQNLERRPPFAVVVTIMLTVPLLPLGGR